MTAVRNLTNDYELEKMNFTAQSMLYAYAAIPRLFSDKVWMQEKYEKLCRVDTLGAMLEYFEMDKEVREALLQSRPSLNHQDFVSLRKIANHL